MKGVIIHLTRGFGSKLLLLALDLLGLILLFNLAHLIRMGERIELRSSPALWMILLITVATLYIMDVYRTEKPATRARLPLQAFLAVPVAGGFSAVFAYAMGVGAFESLYGRGVMPIAFVLFAFWAAFWRWTVTQTQTRLAPRMTWWVVSTQEAYTQISAELDVMGERHQIQHLDSTHPEAAFNNILTTAHNSRHQGLIVFSPASLEEPHSRQIMQLKFRGMNVLTLSEFFEQYGSRVPVLHLGSGWFVESAGFHWVNDHVGLRFQRALDIVVSVIGLFLLWPIFLIVAVLIKLSSRGPALFIQQRVGLNGKLFQLVKFRTMVQEAEKNGAQWAKENDPRVTPLGKYLRASRLDELPQFWNILKGEMSLIGPRPERPEFVEQLEAEIPFYDLRHMVAPGVTGWAQVMYDYGASVEDARRKLEYDLYYIKNHSIQLDFAILIKTLFVVFKRAGR